MTTVRVKISEDEGGRALKRMFGLGVGFAAMSVLTIWAPGRQEALQPITPDVEAGLEAWRANNCAACHSLYGLGGHLGPDLTDVVERRSAELVVARVLGGGAGMPPFQDADGQAIAAYLEWVGSTGTWPPTSWPDWGYGTPP